MEIIKLKTLGEDFPGGPGARLHTPKAGGPGSSPGKRTRSHMQQLKSSPATTEEPTRHNKDRGSHVL